MIYRTLGQTGEKVSVLGLGGFHIGKPELSEQDSVRIIRSALDRGLNFLDNSWDYNGVQSEIRVGKALRDGYWQKAFVMTKIDGRNKQEAAKQIDESLRRLQTDHVDLLQHHEIIRFEDPDRIFAPGGAMEAFLDAKRAGKLRYIGFTGHKDPHIHLHMLQVADAHGFLFDTVQDAAQRDGRAFSQFRENGASGVGEAEHRRIGHEECGRPSHSGKQNRNADRMSALRDEPSYFRSDHGRR
jgi:aryl-alcohol dehydrogenase-like predicted oxidoreductase